MSAVDEVGNQFQSFRAEFDKGEGADLARCQHMLTDLKIGLTKFSFLMPGAVDSPMKMRETLLAREILEYAVLLAVRQRDMSAFARHFAQVKTYYFDSTNSFKSLPPSTRQYPILGLNLLYLLAINRIAEFHTELELIPIEKHENVFIKHPIQLEQYFMEGAYNKVYNAVKDAPAEYYAYFIEYLVQTRLKDEIAECSEKAYESLPKKEAKKMLHIESEEAFQEYARNREWSAHEDRVLFGYQQQQHAAQLEAATKIPSRLVIAQTLAYARELERIV
eukprot:TRINITY_DN783_c0_g1_i1.p1 TRINITY_DN783_c0_g1~~TRINITY_DN783_c0_g1_i1.p1  ORF type:complete len:277 (-),score=67.00 TRINITY_DN783_c0_g1_i1:39-869(-)